MSDQHQKFPAFQFYPSDWQSDPGVKACSLTARGLWVEMLCLMHYGSPYGHLTINSKPIDMKTLARLVGADMRTTCRTINELQVGGVFSIDSKGTIYSRRMVKDEALRRIRRECGALGGNPKLSNLVNQKDKPVVGGMVKQKSTPSVAVAVSASDLELQPHTPRSGVLASPSNSPAKKNGRRADKTNPRSLGTNKRAVDLKQRRAAEAARPKSWNDKPTEHAQTESWKVGKPIIRKFLAELKKKTGHHKMQKA